MNLEQIKKWDGVTGSGKDARLAINRNFQQLSEFLSTLVFGVLSDGSVEHVVAIEEEDFETLRLADQLDEKTYYIVLNPTQQSNIEQLISQLISDIDSKADAQDVAESIQGLLTALVGKASTGDLNAIAQALGVKADLVNGKVPAAQLPESSGVADGSVTPGKIASEIVQQDPDWLTIFSKEGHWVFLDDVHAINRPSSLREPEGEDVFAYKIINLGISEFTSPSCIAIFDLSEVYFLTLEGGNIYVLDIQEIVYQVNTKLNTRVYTQTVPDDLDMWLYAEEGSVMLESGDLNGATFFNFKVFEPTGNKIIQHQMFGDNILERQYDMGTQEWTSWKLIAEDQKKYVLNIDFTVATPFVYNVPQAMKFTSVAYEGSAPALSIALNTNMARYNKLTITPGSVGLVTLTGTLL